MQNESSNQPISVGEWMVNILVTYIPLVNLIMLIVWATGSDTPQSKKNWAIAKLIWVGISTVLLMLFYGVIVALILSLGGDIPMGDL